MIVDGVVRKIARAVMKKLKLVLRYQDHQQMFIQHTHGFNDGRSKLCYVLTVM